MMPRKNGRSSSRNGTTLAYIAVKARLGESQSKTANSNAGLAPEIFVLWASIRNATSRSSTTNEIFERSQRNIKIFTGRNSE